MEPSGRNQGNGRKRPLHENASEAPTRQRSQTPRNDETFDGQEGGRSSRVVGTVALARTLAARTSVFTLGSNRAANDQTRLAAAEYSNSATGPKA
jgi:hypothetical protein